MSKIISTALLALAAVALAAIVILFASDYGALPQTVATHFDAAGSPDGWGPKSTLILLPAIAALFFLIFVLVAPATVGMSGPTPPLFPVLMRLIGVAALSMFFFIENDSLSIGLGKGHGLGSGFFIGLGAVMLTTAVTVVYSVVWAIRARSA
jgi:hypothetical protein